jgi:glycosyltransferase involved in cell wall biosynthesis
VAFRYKAHRQQLAARGHHISVSFTLDEREATDGLDSGVEGGSTDILALPFGARMPCSDGPITGLACAANFLQALAFVRRASPDVIHVTFDSHVLSWLLVARLCSVPIIVAYHADSAVFMARHQVPLLLQLVPLLAEGVAGVMCDTAFTVSKTFRRKIATSWALHANCFHPTCWGPMVDTSIFRPDALMPTERTALRRRLMFGATKGFLLVYAGRVSSEKGLNFVVRLVQRMRKNDAPVHLALVGDGTQRGEFVAHHGAEHGVHFLPKFVSQAEVAAHYCAADAYCTGSEFETLGFGAVEAMACGIPALVPSAQGFQDTVRHGVTGYLFTPRSLDSAEECLRMMMQTPLKLHDLLAAAAEMTLDGCTDRALTVYDDVIVKNNDRTMCGRAISVLILSPLVIVAFVVQQILYYTGLSYAMEASSPWRRKIVWQPLVICVLAVLGWALLAR